jgi:hypothetical protein
MTREDIMPCVWRGMNMPAMSSFGLNAAETFLRGEPVAINAAGRLTESADDPVLTDLLGIAAEDGDTTNASGLATARTRFGQFDDGLLQTGDLINVWIPTYLNFFQTGNYTTDGTGFGDAMAIAELGERAGLTLLAGVWGLDTAVANFTCRIVDFLTDNGLSIQMDTQGVGRVAVFVIHSAQLQSGVASIA